MPCDQQNVKKGKKHRKTNMKKKWFDTKKTYKSKHLRKEKRIKHIKKKGSDTSSQKNTTT